jgi:hypothetical protein
MYGGRGISVCELWQTNFVAFKEWAESAGWKKGLQIDRRDNNGNYTPENCRIVTPAQNSLNTRRNLFITAFGETKTVKEWAEDSRCVVCAKTLRARVRLHGYEGETAITQPIWKRRLE